MTHPGRMVSHQSASSCHCVFACAVIAVAVTDLGIVVVCSCTPPRTMPSHGVARSRDDTSTRQLVHDDTVPPFFTGSCCHCSASRAAYSSIASPSRQPPSPRVARAPFNDLTKKFTRQDHGILRTLPAAAGVRGWSIQLWIVSTSGCLICTGSHGDAVLASTSVLSAQGLVDACRSWGTSARSAPSECHGLHCSDPCRIL